MKEFEKWFAENVANKPPILSSEIEKKSFKVPNSTYFHYKNGWGAALEQLYENIDFADSPESIRAKIKSELGD